MVRGMTDNEIRSMYRQIRAQVCKATGMTAKAFDADAARGAHEYSDGEEVTAYCWLMGARYMAEDCKVGVAV